MSVSTKRQFFTICDDLMVHVLTSLVPKIFRCGDFHTNTVIDDESQTELPDHFIPYGMAWRVTCTCR